MADLHMKTLLYAKCLPPYDRPTIVSCKSNLPLSYKCNGFELHSENYTMGWS